MLVTRIIMMAVPEILLGLVTWSVWKEILEDLSGRPAQLQISMLCFYSVVNAKQFVDNI